MAKIMRNKEIERVKVRVGKAKVEYISVRGEVYIVLPRSNK